MGASLLFLRGCSGPPLRHVAVGWQGGIYGGSIMRTSIYGLYAMAKFVAVGENITLYSLDGMDRSIATAMPGHYHHLRSVARP